MSHERCIFWEDKQALILSDLHFGKSGHFRKSGVAIPQHVFKEDLFRLFSQIQFFKATNLIIVGDLFHSHANKEMELFLKWRNDMSSLHIHLIKGNHDILSNNYYDKAGIEVSDNQWLNTPFCFTHDIALQGNPKPKNSYTFSGHIHPGIRISGISKQSLRFPCFYFTKDFAVLPAFSLFTGLAALHPEKSDNVFALVEKSIVKIQ